MCLGSRNCLRSSTALYSLCPRYLDTLSTLVEVYENEHHAIVARGVSPIEALKFLMEEHGMIAADLGTELGDRTLGSKTLRGERKIGLKYAKTG